MKGPLDALAFLNEVPNDIISHQFATRLPRLFSQTTCYHYSQSHLILFQNAVKKNQHEQQKNSLIDLSINHSILLNLDAQIILPMWINCLEDFRQLRDIHLINRVLATGLLLIIDKAHHDKLNKEFKILLYLFARENPQLANSILAQFASITANDTLLSACKDGHKPSNILNSSCTIISIIDVKLFITPFIDSYKEKKYVSPIVDLVIDNQFYNKKNYINLMHGLLKIMPSSDELWGNSFKMSSLMRYVLFPGISGHSEFITAILVTIQSRISDKKFLDNYSAASVDFSKKDTLVSVVDEAINHDKLSEQSIVDTLYNYYYPRLNKKETGFLSSDFFSRMWRYLDRLEDENHLIDGINMIFPYLEGIYHSTIIPIIVGLVSKVNSSEYLDRFVFSLSHLSMDGNFYYVTHIERLAVICALPQLDEQAVVIHFKALFDLHLVKDCSQLSHHMMATLCLRIKSESTINELHKMLIDLVPKVNDKPLEWFLEHKNFMYFECIMILLVKKQLNEDLIVYLEKIHLLHIGITKDKNFLFRLERLMNRILPIVKSEEVFIYLTKDGGLIEGMLGSNNQDSRFFETISLLMLSLPQDLFKKVTHMLLATKDSSHLIPEHIKKYVEEDCIDGCIIDETLIFKV